MTMGRSVPFRLAAVQQQPAKPFTRTANALDLICVSNAIVNEFEGFVPRKG